MEYNDPSFKTLGARHIASWQRRELRPQDVDRDYLIAGIPSLQRNLVWKPAQTELLWDSLLRRFPIGAFVICRKLEEQESPEEKEAGGFTHHLLDGQQRANAIALGFEDPFTNEEGKVKKPILWLDLKPQGPRGTRTFLFRLTTTAHPWGYIADDAASPLSIEKIRPWLVDHDYLKDGKLVRKRPSPGQCWPLAAGVPVPFSWLVNACEHSDKQTFWEAIYNKCMNFDAAHRNTWAKEAVEFLATNNEVLEPFRTAIQGALAAPIVCLILSSDVLKEPTAQESTEEDTVEGRDNIANVEHLFQRLNAGGTTLDGDELVFSMIKAYWPLVKKPIRDVANRRMPEARLFTLAARAAISLKTRKESEKKRQLLQARLSVSDIRQYGAILKLFCEKEPKEEISTAAQERLGKAIKIRDFIISHASAHSNNRVSLKSVLSTIEGWLGKDEDIDGIGLPPVLKTSIARSSPEVWLLLMWLAIRTLENSDQDLSPTLEMRKRILGLATALHWFGYDKGGAVQIIAEALSDKIIEPAQFKGILAKSYRSNKNNRPRFYPPLSPEHLEKLIVIPENHNDFRQWRWNSIPEDPSIETPFTGDVVALRETIRRVKDEWEILLYAQRQYLKKEFSDYDPSRADLWEQRNRPWDFDHILAQALINYEAVPNKDALKQWISCVGNLRACPMEENRSDQKDRPAEKINTQSALNSFISQAELEHFDQGADFENEDRTLIFVRAAKSRLIRIYQEWYDLLEIGVLVSGA